MTNLLRRYWCFGGAIYYAAGGWNDFIGTADTLEQACALTAELSASRENSNWPIEWWHVLDTETGQLVATHQMPY